MAAQPTLDFVRYTAEETAKLEEVTAGPARALLLQSGLLPQPPPTAVVLDNASGPGVLTTVLFNTIGTDSGVKIVCTDLAEPLIKAAVTRIQVNGWNAEAKVADSRVSVCARTSLAIFLIGILQELPFSDAYFTHNLMNFGIQVIPNSHLALKGPFNVLLRPHIVPHSCLSFRVLQPGGKVGFTWWVGPGWLEDLKIGAGFVEPPMFSKGPWASKDSIVSLLTPIGFTNIDVQPVVCEQRGTVSLFLRFLPTISSTLLVGETLEKYSAHMTKKYGDGEFVSTWEAVVITADKPFPSPGREGLELTA